MLYSVLSNIKLTKTNLYLSILQSDKIDRQYKYCSKSLLSPLCSKYYLNVSNNILNSSEKCKKSDALVL